MIRKIDWYKIYEDFNNSIPFNHVVIDDFFLPEIADKLSEEFPDYNNDITLNYYNNSLENKKALNHWDRFPPCTYRAFMSLGDFPIIDNIKMLANNNDIYFKSISNI